MKIIPWSSLLFVFSLSTAAFGESKFHPLDEYYSAYTKNKGPGFAVEVFKEGKLVHRANFGYANLKSKTKINEKTNFNLASNSKQFTAALALLLEQDGVIKPSDSVSKYIPEFTKDLGKITVEQLIHHTSGLPDYMELCDQKPKVKNSDIVELLSKKELEFPSGSRMAYSNSGYVILSELVQRAAKTPFRELISKRIFQPLGMKGSLVRDEVTEKNIPNRSIGYNNCALTPNVVKTLG